MAELNAINVQLSCCIEDTINKLQISGQIMPLTYEMKKNAKQVNKLINNLSIFFNR